VRQRYGRVRGHRWRVIITLTVLTASCERETTQPERQEFTIVAVGDIASCDNANHRATATLVDSIGGPVLALGDLAYENGSAADFADCYDTAWGRHRARTRPVPGNHEYNTPGATGYFEYFGALAGDRERGYYAFEVGPWLLLALNSNIAMTAGSPQEQWVRQQITATPHHCTLAYWHHPRFSSSVRGSNPLSQDMWNTLGELGADVVLAGHDHIYERFARLDGNGRLGTSNGVASFIVGTGGRSLHALGTAQPGSAVRINTEYGVLRMTLWTGGYSWAFVAVGGSIKDNGVGSCE
jgi:acid phosphatase type 7